MTSTLSGTVQDSRQGHRHQQHEGLKVPTHSKVQVHGQGVHDVFCTLTRSCTQGTRISLCLGRRSVFQDPRNDTATGQLKVIQQLLASLLQAFTGPASNKMSIQEGGTEREQCGLVARLREDHVPDDGLTIGEL
ncbi:hypothetical protein D3C84_786890 [compost metagenome]